MEVNFDALVGLTHNYGGLSYGNIASHSNVGEISNPRAAALQGLEKMWFLANELNIPQGVLPPHERPHIATLRSLGFLGDDTAVLAAAAYSAPQLLRMCSSSASMWAANAATVTPSADAADGVVHFTAANLSNKFHRAIEAEQTAKILAAIFPADSGLFVHHGPLPYGMHFSDEGAANHSRLCRSHAGRGIHFFVYGRSGFSALAQQPRRFPARQAVEAQLAIARLHRIAPDSVVTAQQNPDAIDAGVFHSDVAAVANENVFIYHQQAYLNSIAVVAQLRNALTEQIDTDLIAIEVPAELISLQLAVRSYLFNSQLVSCSGGAMALIAPMECYECIDVRQWLEELVKRNDNPITHVYYRDVRQSMHNGGGPACLRLRVPLTAEELGALLPRTLLDERLYLALKSWIIKNYRDRLTPQDLSDPQLLFEGRKALEELTVLLGLGSIYPFQVS